MVIYRVANTINEKTYIGMNATNSSRYFGNGTYLKSAIKKHGKSNFKKDIIQFGFTSIENLAKAEIEWIKRERESNPNAT